MNKKIKLIEIVDKKPFAVKELRRPLGRIIYECDIVGDCLKCKSSLKRKFIFFKLNRCINPECDNYYLKFYDVKK